ncbi:MAG: RDD family protein [Xanthomonadales bacterium]|nr:RDD family protein [Xanthomonadales bacterium]
MSDSFSPYLPPDASLVDLDEPASLQVASRGQRLANMLIDYVVFLVLVFALTFVQVFAMSEAAFNRYAESNWANLIGIIILSPYYILCEGLWGRTLGKLITGTKVVDDAGHPPSWGKVVGRTLSRLIPFEVFSIFGERRLCWHDSIPGTMVVRCR